MNVKGSLKQSVISNVTLKFKLNFWTLPNKYPLLETSIPHVLGKLFEHILKYIFVTHSYSSVVN